MSSASDGQRVAIVTGGAGGMGRAVAERLRATGMRIVVADLDEERVGQTARELGRDALGIAVDVRSAASTGQLVERTIGELGRLDVLVNCAGVISIAPVAELEESEWDRVMDVNLKGVYLCCRAALPHLRAAGWGRIVSISSDSGKRGDANLAHYTASKFGVIGFTQSLALELARAGVTVNAVCPAITDTEMMNEIAAQEARLAELDVERVRAQMIAEVPIGRATRPADVAATVAFLVSDEAEFITGQAINVTGGRVMS